mgnify:CR=1 FL=1
MRLSLRTLPVASATFCVLSFSHKSLNSLPLRSKMCPLVFPSALYNLISHLA